MTKSYDYHFVRPSTAKLQSRNIEDQCWYHGKIKRVYAQGLLKNDGDFLVRDSITNAGGFVLTGLWHGQPMHFEIHASPSSEPNVTLYHFEDEQFRSVVDLIEFYHSHRRKVTASSGFLLGRPVICSQRAYTLSQSDLLYACSTENFQIEIEAAYAPFLGKPSEKSVPLRNDRTLTQHAILNQAKKRLTGGEYKSEHDLAHLTSTSTPSSPANNPLGTGPLAASRSVFYVNHLDYGPPENHEIPKLNGKTSPPRIPLPISPIVMPEDVDDYCEMDYSAMDELRVETPSPTSLSSAVLSSPSSGSRKRYSEILDASMTDLQSTFDTPINLNNPFRRSAHSLNHNLITPTSAEPYDEQNVPAKLSSYWDRTQSCQNLYGVRMKLNRSTSGTSYGQAMESPIEKETEFKRFPSIRIEPAPILPARSTDNLNSTASPIKETSVDPDYDRIVRNLGNNSTRESDYDRLKFDQESDYGRLKLNQESDYDHPPKNGQKIEKYSRNGVRMEENSQNGGTFSKPTSSNQKSYTNGLSIRPPTAPKPTLAKLKAQSQVGKGMRHLCSFLTASDPRKIALLISIEDCHVFRLLTEKGASHGNPMSKLFLPESNKFREEIMDRNIVLQLAVSLSIQKASTLSEIMRAWVQIATVLYQDIGNAFAFGSIMNALKSELMKQNRRCSDNEIEAYNQFYSKLLPIFDRLSTNCIDNHENSNSCFLPFIQPYLPLISKYNHVENCSQENFEVFWQMMKLARKFVFSIDQLENRARNVATTTKSAHPNGTSNNPFSTNALISSMLEIDGEPTITHHRRIRQMFDQFQ